MGNVRFTKRGFQKCSEELLAVIKVMGHKHKGFALRIDYDTAATWPEACKVIRNMGGEFLTRRYIDPHRVDVIMDARGIVGLVRNEAIKGVELLNTRDPSVLKNMPYGTVIKAGDNVGVVEPTIRPLAELVPGSVSAPRPSSSTQKNLAQSRRGCG